MCRQEELSYTGSLDHFLHLATAGRRVRTTKSSLHGALIGLAHEKPYDSIAVRHILERAAVGRSTFYTHFRDKDDLLISGIHETMRSIGRRVLRHDNPLERAVAFSRPFLEHIDAHRLKNGHVIDRESRRVMHGRLEQVLATLIFEDIEAAAKRTQSVSRVPTRLIAQHVASTFILVLNWWLNRDSALTPLEVDARFRALVMPALSAM